MINLLYIFRFLECGHFCIRYILRKEKVKKKVEYHKQMMSMGLVKRVLSEYFSFVECYVAKSLEDLKKCGRFITMINLRKNKLHYVVIEKVENDYVYYYDPIFIFLRKLKKDKFNKKWCKYCCIYA